MKKIVIAVAVVGIAAVAAQAQDRAAALIHTDVAVNEYYAGQRLQVAQAAEKQADTLAKQAAKTVEKKAFEAKKKAAEKPKEAEAAKKAKKGVKAVQWLKFAFGGQMPGETSEEYYARMLAQSYPANQAFK